MNSLVLASRCDVKSCLTYFFVRLQVEESQEEQREGEIDRYDAFATAMQRIGVIGIWGEKPLLDGKEIKKILPGIPKGPAFRPVMEEQENWMILHPGAGDDFLMKHLIEKFPDYT